MFLVAGDTWRMWFWIIVFNNHLLWQSNHHSNIHWSSSKTNNQAHWDPYALYQGACACTLLGIFRTSSRYLHQSFLWEDIQKSQITTGDCWSCYEAWVMTRFSNFVLLSMFKGGFFPLGFCLFPWLNGHAVCKGWIILVVRPYYFLIFHS